MDNNVAKLWNDCLAEMQESIAPKSFKTWFLPIKPVKIIGSALTLQVPSHYFCEYLEENYIEEIGNALEKIIGNDATLEYLVDVDRDNSVEPMHIPAQNRVVTQNRPIKVPTVDGHVIRNPFEVAPPKLQIDSQLCPTNTFDNYIEGDCNRLARSAGLAIAKSPGKTPFNPLVLYGKPGLGKTHLAQAIGLEVKKNFLDKTVLYVSTNVFQTQFQEAVKNGELNDFLHFYQLIDVLILDDVQELIGKPGTQRIFFHIFNHFHKSQKQLVLTSDKAPADLQGMEERLLSRFRWGLPAEIQAPDFDTRLEILKRKAFADGMEIPEEVFEYIAKNVNNNIRELEGTLISMLAQLTLLNKKEITVELAASILGRITKTKKEEISVESIQTAVCDFYKVTKDALQSSSRKRNVVQARQIAMYFCKEMTKNSLAAIGKQIGNRNHATVLYACKTINNLIETDKKIKSDIDTINTKLLLGQ